MKKRLVFINIFVVFICLFFLLLSSCFIVNNQNRKNTINELESYLNVACEIFDGTNYDETRLILHNSNQNLRITIIALDGTVLTDSSAETEENHLERPEITNLNSVTTRYSETLKINMLYLACKDNSCYIRVAIPQHDISKIVNAYIGYGSLTLVVLMALAILVADKLTKKALSPLNQQVDRLGVILNQPANEKVDDVEVLEKRIDDINLLLNEKITLLEMEKEKSNYILNNVKEGLISIGSNGTINLINDYALNIFSFNLKEIEGKNYLFLFREKELQLMIEECLKNKISNHFELHLNNKIYLLLINSLKQNWISSGEEGLVILLIDITMEKEIDNLKKDFFANASHELKSPLTSIIGYQQMITEGILTEKEEINDASTRTIKEAKRMNVLIGEMLDLSRLESNVSLNKENLDIDIVLDEVIEQEQYLINEKNVKLNYHKDKFDVYMNYGDATKLFKNLIDNAIKYNLDGGMIDINCNKELKQIVISDTGIGISAKDIDHIFERFYRVNKNKSKEMNGTGLGLSIVKHICINNNIKIEVESEIGKGSKFTLIFNEPNTH